MEAFLPFHSLIRSKSPRAPKKAVVRDYVEALVIALFVALVVRLFVLTAYKIPTASMLPTLYVGDFVFAYKLPYGLQIPFTNYKFLNQATPDRGDVVVFRFPSDPSLSFIKRVVAVEGDRIEIRDKRVYLNEVPAIYENIPSENFEIVGLEYYNIMRERLEGSTRLVMFRKGDEKQSFGPQLVPPGHVFVLGDNRDSSDDSRYWGMIPVEYVDGKIVTVWLSLNWNEAGEYPKVRWERILTSVH